MEKIKITNCIKYDFNTCLENEEIIYYLHGYELTLNNDDLLELLSNPFKGNELSGGYRFVATKESEIHELDNDNIIFVDDINELGKILDRYSSG